MKYQIGDIVQGVVTGIQPYGAFVLLPDHTTGLIHISEISADFVKDIHYFVSVGETLELKVIDVDPENGQLRLSLKALRRNNNRIHPRYLGRDKIPTPIIGFRSLETNLPIWIAEKEQEKHD